MKMNIIIFLFIYSKSIITNFDILSSETKHNTSRELKHNILLNIGTRTQYYTSCSIYIQVYMCTRI